MKQSVKPKHFYFRCLNCNKVTTHRLLDERTFLLRCLECYKTADKCDKNEI